MAGLGNPTNGQFISTHISFVTIGNKLQGRLTPSSNVWSFGVTAWEVFSLCRNRPLANLTDVEVLQNAEHFYFDDALQVSFTISV